MANGTMSRGALATWRVVQALALLATLALLAGLVLRPEPSLAVLWKIVIPLVPASLLVSPFVWRNSCPLATLDMLANRYAGGRTPSRRWADGALAVGMGLLLVLVPARRFLFNENGAALAITVAAVALVAIAMGSRYDVKSGFCNAFCPVLPVEKLYGQSPLARVGNARCQECVWCTRGCVDVSKSRALAHMLDHADDGSSDPRWRWVVTPYGAFAAAFPGFVLGYFTTANGPLSAAGTIYGWVLAWALASWLLTAAVARVGNLAWARVLPTLAALAAGAYYWYAAPDFAAALGVGALGAGLRLAVLGLVVVWWARATRQPATRAA